MVVLEADGWRCQLGYVGCRKAASEVEWVAVVVSEEFEPVRYRLRSAAVCRPCLRSYRARCRARRQLVQALGEAFEQEGQEGQEQLAGRSEPEQGVGVQERLGDM